MKYFLCLFFMFFFSSVSYACSCAVSATEQGRIKDMEDMENIFYGKVISVGKEQSAVNEQGVRYENNGEVSYDNETVRQIKFKVLRIWKGVLVEEITVGANAYDSCTLNAEVGDKVLLFTDKRRVLTSLNYINYCNTEILDKTLLRKIYGEGETVKSQKLKQNKMSEYVSSTVRKFIFLPA